jgi:magnesium chelatase subunit I
VLDRLGVPDGAESPALAAAAVEFALEGLHLNRRLAKDGPETRTDGRTVYG